MLLFNLDALNKQEQLIKAQLYFYRRSTASPQTLQIKISEISPYYQSPVPLEHSYSASQGWQILDITSAVKRCTNTVHTNHKLGVSFSLAGSDGTVSMEEFLRHHELPFIITYSNNTDSLDSDQIEGWTGLNEKGLAVEMMSMVDPKAGLYSERAAGHNNRPKRSVSDNTISITDQTRDKLVELDRKINRIPMNLHHLLVDRDDSMNELTNVIEEDSFGRSQIDSGDIISDLTPPPPAPSASPSPSADATNSPTTKVQLIPLPRLPWPKAKKHRRIKKKKNRGQKLPSDWKSSARPETDSCHRESLRLNFEDMGWGTRVIEPKKFDAYYCSGQCNFPESMVSLTLVTAVQNFEFLPKLSRFSLSSNMMYDRNCECSLRKWDITLFSYCSLSIYLMSLCHTIHFVDWKHTQFKFQFVNQRW